MLSDPYCGNCGYSFIGLTESSKCPECGKPVVEVLQRGKPFPVGKRYTSPIQIFGKPLLQVAIGPSGDEMRGEANGIIAVGDVARGWLAIGGAARGLIAIGGRAIGLVTLGGLSLGLFSFGGLAIGGVATGGATIGLIASGGGAIGLIAQGGASIGYYAQGGGVIGVKVQAPYRVDPEAKALFGLVNRMMLLGNRPAFPRFFFTSMLFFLGLYFLAALLVAIPAGLIVLREYMRVIKQNGGGT